jgi:hypothetical protein
MHMLRVRAFDLAGNQAESRATELSGGWQVAADSADSLPGISGSVAKYRCGMGRADWWGWKWKFATRRGDGRRWFAATKPAEGRLLLGLSGTGVLRMGRWRR